MFTATQAQSISRAVQAERERRQYRSLYGFVKGAWNVVEPGTEFVDGWHLGAISSHLELVSDGAVRLLIINMPPRHMKSIEVSVGWPCWEWGPALKPHVRWLFSSYAGSLAVRDSLKCRRLIMSEWYQRHWGDVFSLTGDQNAKVRFENDATGYRLATSVGGTGTGEGGDRVVVDDPHNVNEAESDTVRETTLDWWTQTMSTRLNDPKTGAHVIVMQRVHEQDVTGHELKERADDLKSGEAVHLVLPARYEKKKACVTVIRGKEFWRDPRKKDGELLWPERFGEKELSTLERKLGVYGTSSQLQQRPSPAGGGIFKRKHFKLWPADKPIPQLELVVQSYDTAYTEETTNDPTAMQAWGVFHHPERKRFCALLMDAWQDHLDYPKLRRKAKDEYNTVYGGHKDTRFSRKADHVLIEDKGSGISLRQDLHKAGVPTVKYNPGKADKTARAHVVAPLVEVEVFYVPESAKRPGEPRDWVESFLHALEMFPNSDDDHHVDAFTQLARYLRDTEWLELDPQEEEGPVDYEAKRRATENPYTK